MHFTYLTRRTAVSKRLSDKAFNVAKNPKYDGYQRVLASMVKKPFDKKPLPLVHGERPYGWRPSLPELHKINLVVVVLKMKICQTKKRTSRRITQTNY